MFVWGLCTGRWSVFHLMPAHRTPQLLHRFVGHPQIVCMAPCAASCLLGDAINANPEP